MKPKLCVPSWLVRLALSGAAATTPACQPAPCVPVAHERALVAASPAKPGESTTPARRYPFHDADLPVEARLDDLLAQLTLEEKVECLGTLPNVPRLGIRASDHVEGLHGLALGGPGRWGGHDPVTTTSFPQAIGLAQTWNPELVREVARAEAREARFAFHALGRGGLVVRAPNADMGRDPRWGRNEECYGEDAHLTSTLAVAFVRGLQGEHPKYWQTAALLKHFLANSNEDDRDKTSSDFDARLFHEYYAAPFRAAMKDGSSRAFMTAYNLYNGVPCTIHPVLRSLTMQDWGNDGIICTDAGALWNLVRSQRQSSDIAAAAAAAVHAGISQFLDDYKNPVRDALSRGLLDQTELDQAVRRNFRVMLRLGLLDPNERVPFANPDVKLVPWRTPEHAELARRATRESLVLLKNERELLPLDASRLRRVALIGRLADEVLPDWYGGTPPYTVTPRQGIAERLGSSVRLDYAPDDADGRATELAAAADLAIVCVGNHPTGDAGWGQVRLPSYGREAVDRKSLSLEDEALTKRVFAANPRTIVVLVASFPYAIEWTQKNVPAILLSTHSSQEQGHALADVLFGDHSPAGRLVQTWPRALADLPPMLDYDIRHGRTYLYAVKPPLYPFGFGLSYGRFRYSAPGVSARRFGASERITVTVDVENVGTRASDEVVELYVRRPGSRVARPLQELKGFARVHVEAGQKRRVALPLDASSLAHWDDAAARFTVEPGAVEFRLGRSSAEILARTTAEIQGQPELKGKPAKPGR